jgi:hypothetical protein
MVRLRSAQVESAQGAARAIYVAEGGSYYSPILTLRKDSGVARSLAQQRFVSLPTPGL